MFDRLEFPLFGWHNLEMVIGNLQFAIHWLNFGGGSKKFGEVLVTNVESKVFGDSENQFGEEGFLGVFIACING
jgi:hypothetical protein